MLYMFSDDDKKSAEELSCTKKLPTIVFLNNHDNPALQDFFYKILPILKQRGYKKFLCEGLPTKPLETKYFDGELATCLKDQKLMKMMLQSQGMLDEYEHLSTEKDKKAFCLRKGFPDELAGRFAELTRLISDFKFFKDIIISKFGFQILGTENEVIGDELFLKDVAQSRSGINVETISVRDRLMAEELIKHQGAIMYLGNGHFPGVCQHLLANKAQITDYLFIALEGNLSFIEMCKTEKFRRYASIFGLVPIRLDGSTEGKPAIAADKVLSLDRLLAHTLLKPKTGTAKMMALQMQAISDNHTQEDVGGEINFSLQQFLILANHSKDNMSTIQAMQARVKGCLSRRKTTPLLTQYKEAQKTVQAFEHQESAIGDQMMSAVNAKQYEQVIDLATQAKACQEKANAIKAHIQTLKETASRFN